MSKLDKNIVPVHYDLFFEPDLKGFEFAAKAIIDIEINEDTTEINLHAIDLKIDSIEVSQSKEILESSFTLNKEKELLCISCKNLKNGKARITTEFKGEHNDKLAGFYRSKYKDEKGNEKIMVTSQMEAPYARRAFPCFDEPNKKATFDVSMKIDTGLNAISNMPIASESSNGGKKLVKFETSPVMSTYLLYLGVGEFEFLEGKLRDIDIRIVTTPGKSHEGKFALELTIKFLEYFEKFSEVPYPLPKLDMIAIPDFAAGAMENWGAITFREILLLFDQNKTSTRVKKRIAEVIAHELWHQWSGNLVTMEWWNDLWLNESFATYMAYKAVHDSYPDWNMWQDFVSDSMGGAFSADLLESTHAIAVEVNSPNEIEEIFDAISYGKGGCVLRMIEGYLGNEIFRKGISNYLKEFKYKNAIADDLWNNLAKVSDAPVVEIMQNWINTPGYPIIEVKGEKELELQQRRFFRKTTDDKWMIPLVINSGGKEERILFSDKKGDINLNSNTYYTLNHKQEGFYRVKYTGSNSENLKNIMHSGTINEFERWGIQNDLFNITLLGDSKLDEFLNLIKVYEKEDSYFVLSDIYANYYKIYFIFSDLEEWGEIWGKFSGFISKPFRKNFERLGWDPVDGENEDNKLLRALSISALGFFGEKDVMKEARNKFDKYILGETMNADLLTPILSIISDGGDQIDYNKIKSKYEKCESIEEKIKLLATLYRFKNKDQLKESLDYCLSDKVRIQDLRTVFSIVSNNPYARDLFFDWVCDNWEKLDELRKTHFVFMGLLDSLITMYIGEKAKNKIKKFLDSKDTGYEKTKINAFETMDINTDWLENNKEVIRKYF